MKEKRQSLTALLKRLEKLEGELCDIRKEIVWCLTPAAIDGGEAEESDVAFTLDDLYEAFGRKHKSYAVRLRHALEQRGVTTLAQFLKMTPGQLLDLDGIGAGTLEYTNKAMKTLGIAW